MRSDTKTSVRNFLLLEYISGWNKHQIVLFASILNRAAMPTKKRSREEFEAYLKAILDQDYPKVKYTNPDAWYRRAFKKSQESKVDSDKS